MAIGHHGRSRVSKLMCKLQCAGKGKAIYSYRLFDKAKHYFFIFNPHDHYYYYESNPWRKWMFDQFSHKINTETVVSSIMVYTVVSVIQ